MAESFFEFQQDMNARRKSAAKPRGADSAPPDALTVSQLTAQIDHALKASLPATVLVRGEVSNLKLHSASGHAYFTLKDIEACINCVMFRDAASRLRFELSDGMEVLATGRVGVYAQRGNYQLYVNRLEPLGQGALELAFRKLCQKLQDEGLFEAARKKPIPEYPYRVVLITSRETAALQDMLKVLRRYPWVQLRLFNVPVQGAGAAEVIARAIRDLSAKAQQIGGADVILLARGGGSLEDLWQFNEEVVARAIVASKVPVITGIGHEVDVSVADLVADHHAHTPTEAAQVVVRKWRTAAEDADMLALRLRTAMRTRMQRSAGDLNGVMRHEFLRRPGMIVDMSRQRVDDADQSLQRLMRERMTGASMRLNELAMRLIRLAPQGMAADQARRVDELSHRLRDALGRVVRYDDARLSAGEMRLQRNHPQQMVRLHRQTLDAMSVRLAMATRGSMSAGNRRVDAIERQLNAVGPRQVLSRGYSITTIKKGSVIVRSKGQIKGGERLVTHVGDGQVESIAEDPNQPTLFD